MNLSQEQREKVVETLKTKWGLISPLCSMCGSNNWEVSSQIFELREFHQGSLVVGGQQALYPTVPVICSNCGNTIFLNAIKIGILNPSPSPAQGGGK